MLAALLPSLASSTTPAPLHRWQENLTNHDLQGGVIVQVSFLGIDNTALCCTLQQLDKTRFTQTLWQLPNSI